MVASSREMEDIQISIAKGLAAVQIVDSSAGAALQFCKRGLDAVLLVVILASVVTIGYSSPG